MGETLPVWCQCTTFIEILMEEEDQMEADGCLGQKEAEI